MSVPPNGYRWHHKLAGLLFVIFCFELGVFLLVLPWLHVWERNYLSWIFPEHGWWRGVWLSPYFRGAVSGVGMINLYVAFLEVFRLRRFSTDEEPISVE